MTLRVALASCTHSCRKPRTDRALCIFKTTDPLDPRPSLEQRENSSCGTVRTSQMKRTPAVNTAKFQHSAPPAAPVISSSAVPSYTSSLMLFTGVCVCSHACTHANDRLFNPLECKGNYCATSNNMKLVHWPLMGGLLYSVQRGGTRWGRPPRPSMLYQLYQPTHQRPVYHHCIAI